MAPTITATEEEVIIRFPKVEFEKLVHGEKLQKKKAIDWNELRGLFADDPRFKGKTSVEVQHMLREIWLRKFSS